MILSTTNVMRAPEAVSVSPAVTDAVLSGVRRMAWEWFLEHAELVLLKKKIVIFTVTLRVKDARFIFEALFGPPEAT